MSIFVSLKIGSINLGINLLIISVVFEQLIEHTIKEIFGCINKAPSQENVIKNLNNNFFSA
ncbi:hypothetical protein [Sodaliphilus sp.]|uniref:hypothetical protein n=1 Tax=Sodaliphilus sp. TaxID=2815818 RepID=UPI00389069C7